jgi:phospholipase/carboxylesterase
MSAKTLTAYSALPPDGRKPTSLVVLLHGVGSNGEDLIGLSSFWHRLLPAAEFVSPDAPEPYDMAPVGYQWFSLADRGMAAMVAGAQASAPILNKFLDELLVERGFTDKQLALVGFSQGTMMALHVGLRRPHAPAAILGYSGMLLQTPDFVTATTAKPPTLLVHGTEDPVLPFQVMELAKNALGAVGVPVETLTRPGLGHTIDEVGASVGGAFVAKALGDAAT